MSWLDLLSDELENDKYLEKLLERQRINRGEQEAYEEKIKLAKEDAPIITIENWIDNEYFSGSFARTMYPKLKEKLIKVINGRYHTIIMGGSTRYGKTVFSMALKARSMYEVSRLANPQRTFGLMDESSLLYLAMNVNEKKARDAFFTKYSNWVRSTEYFKKEFAPQANVITQLRLPKNILMNFSGAQRTAAESEDLFFFVGDEANLYDIVDKSKRAYQGDKYDAAEEIETEVNNRMQGTFMDKVDGSYPSACKIVWLCKETYPESFIRRSIRKIRQLEREKPGDCYILESTEWGLKPRHCSVCRTIVDEKQDYCQLCNDKIKPIMYFWIKTATRQESAKIILEAGEAGAERSINGKKERANAPHDEIAQVVDVPLVYLDAAKANIEKFQRDMCGIATEAISVFYPRREPLFASIRQPGSKALWDNKTILTSEVCRHPFTAMNTDTKDGVSLIPEMFAVRVATGNRDEKDQLEYVWQPRINPFVPRFLGLDMGLTGDAVGISMAHRCGWKKVIRYTDLEEPMEELAPITWVDMMLQIVPPKDQQIPFGWIRALIYNLMKLGFSFQKITCDSFQHVAITQPLTERGLNVEVVSVDTSMDPYNAQKMSFEEGRISVYDYAILFSELIPLERVVTGRVLQGRPIEKVDHTSSSEKDLADSLAQVVYQIELDSETVAKYEDLPSTVAFEKTNNIVNEYNQEQIIRKAFEAGDFEKLMRIENGEEDDW